MLVTTPRRTRDTHPCDLAADAHARELDRTVVWMPDAIEEYTPLTGAEPDRVWLVRVLTHLGQPPSALASMSDQELSDRLGELSSDTPDASETQSGVCVWAADPDAPEGVQVCGWIPDGSV